jgi:hypothetical protein
MKGRVELARRGNWHSLSGVRNRTRGTGAINIKSAAIRVLKSVGLFQLRRTAMIRFGFDEPTQHGHSLLLQAMNEKEAEIGSLAGCVCVEIGSTREDLPDHESTAEVSRQCLAQGVRFLTVDMDPESAEEARKALLDVSPDFETINAKGEDFLKSYEGRVDFLYLDAFDIDHGKHSELRKLRSRAHLGAEITNEACYRMHLDCATEAVRLMAASGVIVFDDAWREGGGWGGKGHSAMPLLLESGFEVVKETRNTVWLER